MTEIERWRGHAGELRAAAEVMINDVARDAMLDMAQGYDRLADRLETFYAKKSHGDN